MANTTWAELKEKGLIERCPVMGAHQYHLTEYGWLTGLELNGTLEDEAFRAKCIGLIKYFKAQVAGRRETFDALVSHYALPVDLLFGLVLQRPD